MTEPQRQTARRRLAGMAEPNDIWRKAAASYYLQDMPAALAEIERLEAELARRAGGCDADTPIVMGVA